MNTTLCCNKCREEIGLNYAAAAGGTITELEQLDCQLCGEYVGGLREYPISVEVIRAARNCLNVCDGIVTMDSEQRQRCLREIVKGFAAREAAKDARIAALVGELQQLQPAGSPPPGDELVLVTWIRQSVRDRIAALEATVREVEANQQYLVETSSKLMAGAQQQIIRLTGEVAELKAKLAEAEKERDSHLEAWNKKSALLDKWQSLAGRLERSYKSIYTILGWMNEPPIQTIERELCLMKERIAAIPEMQSQLSAAEAKLASVRGLAGEKGNPRRLLDEIYELVGSGSV